jgi:hypothetical protein
VATHLAAMLVEGCLHRVKAVVHGIEAAPYVRDELLHLRW